MTVSGRSVPREAIPTSSHAFFFIFTSDDAFVVLCQCVQLDLKYSLLKDTSADQGHVTAWAYHARATHGCLTCLRVFALSNNDDSEAGDLGWESGAEGDGVPKCAKFSNIRTK